MTEQRNAGSTKRLIEVLQANRGTIYTNDQLAEMAGVKVDSVGKLLSQIKVAQPDLLLEQPTRGMWVYRGWRDDPTNGEPQLAVVQRPVKVKPAAAVTSRTATTTAALVAGDVCEIVGFSQDGTPLARDGYGKLYLMQPL